MNEALLKKIGFYALGGIVGGAVGYFSGQIIAKKFFPGEEEPIIHEYDILVNAEPPSQSPDDLATKLPEDGKKPDVKKVRGTKTKPVNYDQMRENIEDVARKYLGKSSLQEEVTDEEEEEEEYPMDDPDLPYIISVGDYEDTECPNIKRQLIYYEPDDVLTYGDTDQIISDPEQIVGNQALVNFGKGSNDPDIVYVRDNKLGIDYEICRQEKSYTEMVVGVPPKKSKPRVKKVKDLDADEED